NFTAFGTLLPHLLGHNGYHLMAMIFDHTGRIKTNHMVAAYTQDGRMNFFDSNSGEYEVDLLAHGRQFFQALVNQYRTYRLAKRTWGLFADREPVIQAEWHCFST